MASTPLPAGSSPYVGAYGGSTPIGSGGYADHYKAYSPAGGAGGGSQHAYSPTGLNNPYQSPAYSPTTPNYVQNYGGTASVPGITQHMTASSPYGGPSQNNVPAVNLNIRSPAQVDMPSASNAYGASYGAGSQLYG